jgi:hypothetical protein
MADIGSGRDTSVIKVKKNGSSALKPSNTLMFKSSKTLKISFSSKASKV